MMYILSLHGLSCVSGVWWRDDYVYGLLGYLGYAHSTYTWSCNVLSVCWFRLGPIPLFLDQCQHGVHDVRLMWIIWGYGADWVMGKADWVMELIRHINPMILIFMVDVETFGSPFLSWLSLGSLVVLKSVHSDCCFHMCMVGNCGCGLGGCFDLFILGIHKVWRGFLSLFCSFLLLMMSCIVPSLRLHMTWSLVVVFMCFIRICWKIGSSSDMLEGWVA